MSVKVPDIILEVRRMAQDKGLGQDQRNSDYDIRGALRLALFDMRRARPDYFISFLDSSPVPDTREVDDIPVDDFMLTPLALVTTGYLLLEVDDYSDDGTARNMITLGRNQMGGTP